MFDINDDFLVSVGYDLALLSDEQIAQYKKEMTEEMTARLSERFARELSEEQVGEFEEIQTSTERAQRWLEEFHAGYEEREEYKNTADNADDRDEAARFYASMLWLNDAVPKFGELVQEEIDAYQAELVEKRRKTDDILKELI